MPKMELCRPEPIAFTTASGVIVKSADQQTGRQKEVWQCNYIPS